MSVLVVAPDADAHARTVRDAIVARGHEATILDVARFPRDAHLSVRYTCCRPERHAAMRIGDDTLDFDRVGSVWWRRAGGPVVSDAVRRPTHAQFAWNESHEALAGLWPTLDARWINDPMREERASHKGWQLRVAQDCGLRIPATMLTSDPDQARRFIDSHGYRNVIFKSFSSTLHEWRETRLVGSDELAMLDQVRHAPVIFQRYVEASHDLRISIVDGAIFAAAIHSQDTAYEVDSRVDIAHARIEAVTLPQEIEAKLLALMERLSLVYGAIDMRVTPDDTYVFLEINPSGQFLYIEAATGQPISSSIAAALMVRDAKPH